MNERPPLDKDIVVDIRGIHYSVIGYYHYDNMVTVIPKYVPTRDEFSPWRFRGTRYRRIIGEYGVKGVRRALNILTGMNVDILRYHHAYGEKVPQLLRGEIEEVMYPERGLEELLHRGPSDELEETAVLLVDELKSNFKGIKLGITGSLLSRIYEPKISDVDITIYGIEWVERVSRELWGLEGVERPRESLLEEMAVKYWREGRLPLEVARRSVRRRWNRFTYRGRMISLLPVLTVDEAKALPKPRVRTVRGRIVLRGVIHTTKHTPFYPPRWRLEVKDVIVGRVTHNEVELLCFEHLYSSAFEDGEGVYVEGLIQEVVSEDGTACERVVVGGLELEGKIRYH